MNDKKSILLTDNEIEFILKSLSALPYSQVAEIINNIGAQAYEPKKE